MTAPGSWRLVLPLVVNGTRRSDTHRCGKQQPRRYDRAAMTPRPASFAVRVATPGRRCACVVRLTPASNTSDKFHGAFEFFRLMATRSQVDLVQSRIDTSRLAQIPVPES